MLSTGRIELAEVTGVGYAPSQAHRENTTHYFPIAALPAGPHELPAHQRPRLPAALGAELTERVRHESLRDLAVAYDVSHETVRGMLQRQHERNLAALLGT